MFLKDFFGKINCLSKKRLHCTMINKYINDFDGTKIFDILKLASLFAKQSDALFNKKFKLIH